MRCAEIVHDISDYCSNVFCVTGMQFYWLSVLMIVLQCEHQCYRVDTLLQLVTACGPFMVSRAVVQATTALMLIIYFTLLHVTYLLYRTMAYC